MLNQMSVVDFPNLKTKERNKRHKKLFSLAYPDKMKKKAVSLESIAGFLNTNSEKVAHG